VALGFLLLDPEQLFDAGFQLTFMAVGFLGAFASPLLNATTGPLMRGLSDLGDIGRDMHLAPRAAQFRIEMRLLISTLRLVSKMPARLASLVVAMPARAILFFLEVGLVSAVSQVGLALPMVVYFHRVGLSGLSANAFIVPILGIAVPIGFVAMFTGWAWLAGLAGWLLGISRTIVGWHAAMEPHWRIPPPPLWLGIAFAAALIAFAACQGRRRWSIATGAMLGVFLTLLLWHPFPPDTRAGELEMTAIDVGQGDSILVVFPDGKRMLVDGGGIPSFGAHSRTQLDIGEDVVAPYLWERSIRSLDVIALTHAHEDHIGGLPAIEDDFHPKELWTGVTPDSPTWRKLQGKAAKLGTKIVPMYGPRKFQFGGAEIEVLAPLTDYVPHDIPTNDDSLVMRIRYGARSFLLCGDVEKPIERRMVADSEIERTDVLKVGHHGSRTSSTEGFLEAVAPVFAVISVGPDNSYGHPNRDVLDRLAEHHAAVYRTDQDGLVTVRTDGKRLWLETNISVGAGMLAPIFQ
jgi:competence protein ComEC